MNYVLFLFVIVSSGFSALHPMFDWCCCRRHRQDASSESTRILARESEEAARRAAVGTKEVFALHAPPAPASIATTGPRALVVMVEAEAEELKKLLAQGVDLLSRSTRLRDSDLSALLEGRNATDADSIYNKEDLADLYSNKVRFFVYASCRDEKSLAEGFLRSLEVYLGANSDVGAKPFALATYNALRLLNVHKQKGLKNCLIKAGLIAA